MRHKWFAMSLLAPFAVALALNVGAIRTAEAAVVNSTVAVIGVPHQTDEIADFQTTGNNMGGMEVTAFFADGSSELVIWTGLGGTSGAASGTGWKLAVTGDTFDRIWTLTNDVNETMIGLRIYAAPGDTMFDRTRDQFNDVIGTPGSARGRDFTVFSGPDGLLIDVTYSNIVNLTGFLPFGDLYATMSLAFNPGLNPGEILRFRADSDSAALAGGVRPTPVPEPAAMALVGIGLFGLGLAVRRRRRAA
jgi:hypothetical protein